jgi:hypothetical protein
MMAGPGRSQIDLAWDRWSRVLSTSQATPRLLTACKGESSYSLLGAICEDDNVIADALTIQSDSTSERKKN